MNYDLWGGGEAQNILRALGYDDAIHGFIRRRYRSLPVLGSFHHHQ